MTLDLNLYRNRHQSYKAIGKAGNVESIQNNILRNFGSNPSYFDVKINDEERGVHIVTESNNRINRILSKPNEAINAGDYIIWNDKLYLCTHIFDDSSIQYVGTIQHCTLELKWIDENNNLITKPAIVSAKTLYTTGIKNEKVIEIPNGMVGLQLSLDKDSIKLDRERVFIFNKTKYELTFYNEVEFPGVLVLICTETEPSYLDDRVNNIAGRWVETDRGLIDRLPWLDSQMPQEPEPELKPSKGITYSYTAKMPYPNDPDDEIWVTDNATYTIHKFVDGVEVEGDFTFEIETLEGDKNIAKITDTTNNSVTVTGNNPTLDGLILLKAIDIDTGDIAIEKEIKIMGV